MKLSLPVLEGLSLEIADRSTGGKDYPTRQLEKGLLLLDGGRELVEEGVGFGVPILKRGIQTVFPRGMELAWQCEGPLWEVTAVFEMGLVERLARSGGTALRSRSLYTAKNSLAALHRRSPVLRRPLTATSIALRQLFGWVTTFEESGFSATLRVTYTIQSEEGRVAVAVDMPDLPGDSVTEVVVMNEQGARHFDRYLDSDGTTLLGTEIGTWDEVVAAKASFVCTAHRVAFSLGQVEGARLHRGRELIGSRVAWSGFGYSFPPTRKRFGYDLRIERTS